MALPVYAAAPILALALMAVICDVRSQTFPGALTLGALGLGVASSALVGGGLTTSLIGAAAGLLLAGAFVCVGWVREGDALLLAAIGAWTSWHFVLAAIAWTAV